jgi:hypothetical protein
VTGSLTDEERAKIAMHYEMTLELLLKRHGISESELVDAVQWVKLHKEWVEAMKRGSSVSLIGFLFGALLLALWEGVKHLAQKP